jgi:hypothetical protein
VYRVFALIPPAFARFDSGDFGFDQEIVGAADHDEMFGIVAADDDELALTVEIEGIDDAKPRLAGPAARQAQPTPEQHLTNRKQQEDPDEKGQEPSTHHQRLII